MRVVYRVHGNTPNRWALTAPAVRTGFTERTQIVFTVTDFA
jgi:hypothetical protein